MNNILMLIDGNALVYRSFYGMPPLTTRDGTQVNAVYGFASSIFHAIEKFHPEYICVAFDVSKKTWRNKEYPEYKANRQKTPQELYDQLPLVKEIVNVLNIPQFGFKNYEADDVIGTIADRLRTKNEKLRTIVVTGDMDTLQLVNENTEVYSVSRGVKRAEIFNPEKVHEKYGFPAKYLIDYKALRGDPSDNIPGVTGIGEKTATKLVQEFGTIEKLYEKLSVASCQSSVSEKIKKLLIQYKNQAFLSKKLATIVKDVPIDFNLSHCKVHDYNKTKAEKLFCRLEFKSLLRRLPDVKPNHKQESLF